MNIKNNIDIIKNSKKTILVVGDLMLDEYIVGHEYRISDEAPVPILKVDSFDVRLGGAANVAVNIKSLGGEVILCGSIGSKQGGGLSNVRILKLLGENSISSEYIVSTGFKTTTKTRVIIKGQQVVRYDWEDPYIPDDNKIEIMNNLKNIDFKKIDAIIISDYNKGVIFKEVVDFLKTTYVPIFVDPKPKHKDMYYNVFCMTPNLSEFNELSENKFDFTSNIEDIFIEAKKFRDKMRIDNFVITMGDRGALCIDDKNSKIVPSVPVQVANPIGAGDTFISMLVLSMSNNISLENSVELANIAAAKSVAQKYTGICKISDFM